MNNKYLKFLLLVFISALTSVGTVHLLGSDIDYSHQFYHIYPAIMIGFLAIHVFGKKDGGK